MGYYYENTWSTCRHLTCIACSFLCSRNPKNMLIFWSNQTTRTGIKIIFKICDCTSNGCLWNRTDDEYFWNYSRNYSKYHSYCRYRSSNINYLAVVNYRSSRWLWFLRKHTLMDCHIARRIVHYNTFFYPYFDCLWKIF